VRLHVDHDAGPVNVFSTDPSTGIHRSCVFQAHEVGFRHGRDDLKDRPEALGIEGNTLVAQGPG